MQGEGAAAPSPLHPYLFRGTVTPPLAGVPGGDSRSSRPSSTSRCSDVERTAILAPVIVTAMVQARVTTAEVPVIRDIGRLTAVCCAREQCPFKTACCRNGEVGRIARRGRADQRAIRAVAEVVGIADDIQAVIVVIAAVQSKS